MFGKKYYFGSSRKYIALFGSLFNDIVIDRVDNSNNTIQTLKVPLSYGPKDRYLARLKENPDLQRQINQILPRMSFEIKSIEYDPTRKLNSVGKNRKSAADQASPISYQFNPVPFNFNIDLSILVRNPDDGLRIIEQILPFFKPEWTTQINLIPEMNIHMDIPIVLKNVQYQDTFVSDFNDRQAIIWDLSFVLKGYFYGPVSSAGIIKEVDVNFYVPTTNTAAEGVSVTSIAEYVQVTPGLDGNGAPTSNASISIPVSQISANSDYGYIKDFFTNIG
jgi:hypothetical protein